LPPPNTGPIGCFPVFEAGLAQKPDLKKPETQQQSSKKTANSPEWGMALCTPAHENSFQLLSQFTRIEEKTNQ
jgi:hypothetical protein